MCHNRFNQVMKATGIIIFLILLSFLVFWTVKSILPVEERRGETDLVAKLIGIATWSGSFYLAWFQQLVKDKPHLYQDQSFNSTLNSTLNSAIVTEIPTITGLTTTTPETTSTTTTPLPGDARIQSGLEFQLERPKRSIPHRFMFFLTAANFLEFVKLTSLTAIPEHTKSPTTATTTPSPRYVQGKNKLDAALLKRSKRFVLPIQFWQLILRQEKKAS